MEIIGAVEVTLRLTDGPHQGQWALQQRSPMNKTHQYLCQGTWAGKLEPGESINQAIQRECQEELGAQFAGSIDFSSLEEIGNERNEVNGKHYLIHAFVGEVSSKTLGLVDMHAEGMKQFIFIDEKSNVFPMSSGMDAKENIVVFDDMYRLLGTMFTWRKT